ncbi:hypothetical protein K490DRAFT_57309 [Saccharata proteae CBS 121410]|uniref:Uncharacterized protein n=1 Tax=Saccharata proteae CBS 121410 TaxID=1314787 RepID=A0A9P4HTZ5_9PEZI|nr:hypothetical protein K490DRAFT_57309 [Saccharata proteae CBS 121410]
MASFIVGRGILLAVDFWLTMSQHDLVDSRTNAIVPGDRAEGLSCDLDGSMGPPPTDDPAYHALVDTVESSDAESSFPSPAPDIPETNLLCDTTLTAPVAHGDHAGSITEDQTESAAAIEDSPVLYDQEYSDVVASAIQCSDSIITEDKVSLHTSVDTALVHDNEKPFSPPSTEVSVSPIGVVSGLTTSTGFDHNSCDIQDNLKENTSGNDECSAPHEIKKAEGMQQENKHEVDIASSVGGSSSQDTPSRLDGCSSLEVPSNVNDPSSLNILPNLDAEVGHEASSQNIISEHSQKMVENSETLKADNTGLIGELLSPLSSIGHLSGNHFSDSQDDKAHSSETSASDCEIDKYLKAPDAAVWTTSEEFILRDNILVGITYEHHQVKTDALEEKVDSLEEELQSLGSKTAKKINYEQAARKRALAKIQKLEEDSKDKDQELSDSRRTVMSMQLQLDTLRDEVLAGTAGNNASIVPPLAAQQAAQRLQSRMDTTINDSLAKAFEQRDAFAVRCEAAEESARISEQRVARIQDDFKLGGWRKEQMQLICKQNLDKVKAFRDDNITKTIDLNKKSLEFSRLSTDMETLQKRNQTLEAIAKNAFDELIPALDRFHEDDVKTLVDAVGRAELPELQTLAEWYEDLSAKAFNTADALEAQVAENQHLQIIIADNRTEINGLEIQVESLNGEKERLDARVWELNDREMVSDHTVQRLEEDLKLREQLLQTRHELKQHQTSTQNLEEVQEKLNTANRHLNVWADDRNRVYAKYATAFNGKRDAEDALNHFRVAVGLEPLQFIVDSEAKRPMMSELWSRLKGPPVQAYPQDAAGVERWHRMLKIDNGCRFNASEVLGADDDNDDHGFMIPVGDGLFRKVTNAYTAEKDEIQNEIKKAVAGLKNNQPERSTTPDGRPVDKPNNVFEDQEANEEAGGDVSQGEKVQSGVLGWDSDIF